jgi:prepilin-type N-terminal cleavage/methylation domain-containing protein
MSASPAPRRAFTLLELLVTIGIIALLASLIIVVLGGARASANRTESTNALRSMLRGYAAYSADNGQQLMPGYLDVTKLQQLRISPKLDTGVPIDPALATGGTGAPLDPNDASSYVWRLAPYLDHEWKTMFTDYRNDSLMTRLDLEVRGAARLNGSGGECGPTNPVYGPGSASEASCDDLGIGLTPSFGLNSIYVGGDNVHGGSEITSRNPWDNPYDKIAATRLSEVKNPARLIVFAPSAHYAEVDGSGGGTLFPSPPVSNATFGYVEIRAPRVVLSDGTVLDQWEVDGELIDSDAGDFSATDSAGRRIGGGVPTARWGKDLIPTGRLDGSVSLDTVPLIGDPFTKLWSPFSVGSE